MNEEIWGSEWITQDACVWAGKLEVACIIVTAKDTECSVTFHKGRDSGGNIFAVVDCLAKRSLQICFVRPVYLENGLYVVIDANTKGVFVAFNPISEITEQEGG